MQTSFNVEGVYGVFFNTVNNKASINGGPSLIMDDNGEVIFGFGTVGNGLLLDNEACLHIGDET